MLPDITDAVRLNCARTLCTELYGVSTVSAASFVQWSNKRVDGGR